MSRFSGKCDFYDEIMICGLDHILSSEVYVGNSEEPLELKCLADCVPYYPHIVSVASHDNVKKCGYIKLSDRPWFEIEAERYGDLNIHRFYRDTLDRELELSRMEGYAVNKK